MADWLDVVRIVHVAAAAIWLGGGTFAVTVMLATVKKSEAAGIDFMLAVTRAGRLAKFFGPASVITVLAGLVLYWGYGYASAPFGNRATTIITTGGILGVLVLIEGLALNIPLTKRMEIVAKSVGPAGPSPEQAAAMRGLLARLQKGTTRGLVLLVIVFLLMVGRVLVL